MEVRTLIGEWCRIALTAPELFTDEESEVPNDARFKEHRHDQALLSALLFTRGWCGSGGQHWACIEATRIADDPLTSRIWGDDQPKRSPPKAVEAELGVTGSDASESLRI